MEEQRQTEEPKIKKAKVVKVSAQRKEQFRDIVSNVFAAEHTDNINYPDLIEKINRKVYELQIALIWFNAQSYSYNWLHHKKRSLGLWKVQRWWSQDVPYWDGGTECGHGCRWSSLPNLEKFTFLTKKTTQQLHLEKISQQKTSYIIHCLQFCE